MSFQTYFQRFAFCERQIAAPPPPDLEMVVVIPCFNEPDLLGSLESLWACERPTSAVEVIVVVNSPRDCHASIRLQNQRTIAEASPWIAKHAAARFTVHVLDFPDLPAKQAGVGLARKIGMDEAVRRCDDVRKPKGVIVCYDADCRCERNYLCRMERHFQQNPRSPGCSIYFEHPLHGSLEPKIYEAIAAYELHLRYYVQALRYAAFPYAHHTIGSSMAVRADAYARQGGMNKRQAGEDFYFLHKVIPLGGFTDLTATAVYPSPRPSDRVPFGTGKAVGGYLQGKPEASYPLQAFLDLKTFFGKLPELYRSQGSESGSRGRSPSLPTLSCAELPESVATFLQRHNFAQALEQIRENTSSEAAFRKRFFHWFNGFQAMKFVHHARDHFYGQGRVQPESQKLLALLKCEPEHGADIEELLKIYRRLDRSG